MYIKPAVFTKLRLAILSVMLMFLSTGCLLGRSSVDSTVEVPDQTIIKAENTKSIEMPTQTNTPVSPSLKNYGALHDLVIGTYIPWQGFQDTEWQQIAVNEFALVNIFDGFMWSELEPQRGIFDFSVVDPQVEFAVDNNMQVCAHTLLWPSYKDSYPEWVLQGHYSKSELSAILEEFIKAVMEHYKGKINCWIAVEEPYQPSYRQWDLLYYTFGGYDYIDLVYQVVRQNAPDALLIYNDEYNYTPQDENSALTLEIINRLKEKDILDGVGMEMHLNATVVPSKTDVIQTMQDYGIPVHVTELDVDLSDLGGTTEERYALQAAIYVDILNACLESQVCQSFSVWGFGDKYSFLERYSLNADATLFNDNLEPKPAYHSLLDILKQ